VKRERKESKRMSKVSRDRKKAEAAGKKPQKRVKAAEGPAEKKEPEEKGLTAACCRCRSYRKKTDDGPKCQKTGKHVARKFLCGDF